MRHKQKEIWNKYFIVLITSVYFSLVTHAQEVSEDSYEDDLFEILEPLNDPSSEGQLLFVEELLDIAGYVPEKIVVYQSLPNHARVYRVRLDSVNKGYVFIRWDASKQENYVANKMIEQEWFYNLNTAREIMRKQTDKATFSVKDVALKPKDQIQLSPNTIRRFPNNQNKSPKAKKTNKSLKNN